MMNLWTVIRYSVYGSILLSAARRIYRKAWTPPPRKASKSIDSGEDLPKFYIHPGYGLSLNGLQIAKFSHITNVAAALGGLDNLNLPGVDRTTLSTLSPPDITIYPVIAALNLRCRPGTEGLSDMCSKIQDVLSKYKDN